MTNPPPSETARALLWRTGVPEDVITRALTLHTHELTAARTHMQTPDLAAVGSPTQLRWGLNDVEWGDDGTTTVFLSGPTRKPYHLELDPESAAVLRQDLSGPLDGTQIPLERPAGLSQAERDMFGLALDLLQERVFSRGVEFTDADRDAVGSLRRLTADVPCAECEHPQSAHSEAEDPVSPVQCTECDDDDAWHNYEAAAAHQDDTAPRATDRGASGDH